MKHILFILMALPILLIVSCDQTGSGDTPTVIFDKKSMKGTPGFFRVGQSTDGQWWFIDPEGQPFFYKGVCAVNRAGTAGGRRAKPGPYAVTIDKKYNYQESPDTFVHETFQKLRSWGFNALGAWATEEFFDKGMPYTEILEFFKEGPYIEMTGAGKSVPDIFSEEWKAAIDKKARALCSPKRNSKVLVGYFTDNEIGFGRAGDFGLDPGFKNAGRFGFSLLRETLGLDSSKAAYKKAWEFIFNRYSNLNELAFAWKVPINKQNDIALLNKNQVMIQSPAYSEDAQAFSALYASMYFQLVNEAIKRYDPNHLILGCRFGSPPDEYILEAMKPWVDVISQNNYRPVMYERIDYLYEATGLPVLIGEFSWNTDLFKKVPLPGEPEGGLSLKNRMFTRGEIVLKRAARHPAMIGYTWYRWVQPASTDEKFTDGLVDYQDQTDIHPPELKNINPELTDIHKHTNQTQDATGEKYASLILKNIENGKDQVFELLKENNHWKEPVYGWQAIGDITNEHITGEETTMNINIDYLTWEWKGTSIPGGYGQYEIKLTKKKNYWNGTYNGIYNDEAVSGTAKIYVFTP